MHIPRPNSTISRSRRIRMIRNRVGDPIDKVDPAHPYRQDISFDAVCNHANRPFHLNSGVLCSPSSIPLVYQEQIGIQFSCKQDRFRLTDCVSPADCKVHVRRLLWFATSIQSPIAFSTRKASCLPRAIPSVTTSRCTAFVMKI